MNDPPSRRLNDLVAVLTAETMPYLSCDECFDQICAYAEQVAANPAHRQPELEIHLRACAICAEEAATLLALVTGDPRGAPPWVPATSTPLVPES